MPARVKPGTLVHRPRPRNSIFAVIRERGRGGGCGLLAADFRETPHVVSYSSDSFFIFLSALRAASWEGEQTGKATGPVPLEKAEAREGSLYRARRGGAGGCDFGKLFQRLVQRGPARRYQPHRGRASHEHPGQRGAAFGG